jgi:hypothetical protein
MSSTFSKKTYRYYRCHTNKCTYIPADVAEEAAERELMSTLGDEDVTERVWVPGSNNEAELRSAVAAVEELSATAGMLSSKAARDRLQRQLTALDTRIAELEAMPAREGRYEDRPTGEKYRRALERTADDPDERRALLKRVGVDIRMGIIDGRLLVHPVRLGDRLVVRELDEDAAAAERRKWGVPDPD